MNTQVILVDQFDNAIDTTEKLSAHESPKLHRAFSIFIYHEGKLLIQQRAHDKYHAGGMWANTCCSHPRPGEDLNAATERRLLEEVGITAQLEEIFSFIYFYKFDNGLYEYEYDHVFIGSYNGEFSPNPEEINTLEWIKAEDLLEDLLVSPEKYAPWFIAAAPRVIDHILKNKL